MKRFPDIAHRQSAAEQFSSNDLEILDYEISASPAKLRKILRRLCVLTSDPGVVDPKRVVHFSGISEGRAIYTEVWKRGSSTDLTAQARTILDFTEVLPQELRPDAEITCRRQRVHRLVLGDAPGEFASAFAQPNPDCVAFALNIPEPGPKTYDDFCEAMRFPELIPRGMLMHLASEISDELRTVTAWRAIEDSREFMRERIIAVAPEFVRSHQIVPEVRPIEIQPTLLAINNPGSVHA